MKLQNRLIEATEAVERNTRRQVCRIDMSIREKVAFISKYGQAEYLKLPFRRR